jgi:glutamate 5-kinase
VGKGSELSTGGMASKLQSAGMVASNGIPVVIANGRTDGVITDAAAGRDTGTLIAAAATTLSHRERWIALFHRTQGVLVVDDGAREALRKKGAACCPLGSNPWKANSKPGAVVAIRATDGTEIARGLTDYSSTELTLLKGKHSTDLPADTAEVIHRDNMVFGKKEEARGNSRKDAE